MKTAWIIIVAVAAALSGVAAAQGAQTPRQPNIVYIMADDLGWTDLACYGSKYYQTPAIDRLAFEGMRFTQAYTCQNCAPTRAALMSGQYAPRTGVYTVGSGERGRIRDRRLIPAPNTTRLPADKITLAAALKRGGYATGMFGKWHLGESESHHPAQRGFDEAIVTGGAHHRFSTNPRVPVPEGAYLADFLADKAVDFIERHRDKPFFLYLPHFGVHSPYQAKPELVERFKATPSVGGHNDPVYAAMIASVDESVGRVVAKLRELGLEEHTIVVFTSDNGGVGGYREIKLSDGGVTTNVPLRGGKGMLYEGGVRVPLIVRWPAAVKTGAICDQPVHAVDHYRTLLEAANVTEPAGYTLDGASYAAQLRGAGVVARDIFWHMPGYLEAYGRGGLWRTTPVSVIRSGDYKLMEFFEDGRLELYNLAADIAETRDLASAEPVRVKQLHEKLIAWRRTVGAPIPTVNPDFGKDIPGDTFKTAGGKARRKSKDGR